MHNVFVTKMYDYLACHILLVSSCGSRQMGITKYADWLCMEQETGLNLALR
jgi:hypothetical protein